MAPSSQFDFPSERIKLAIRIDAKVAVVSIGPKFNDSQLLISMQKLPLVVQ